MKSGGWVQIDDVHSKIKVYNHIYKPLANCFSLITIVTIQTGIP
jgi:hypothetical protein